MAGLGQPILARCGRSVVNPLPIVPSFARLPTAGPCRLDLVSSVQAEIVALWLPRGARSAPLLACAPVALCPRHLFFPVLAMVANCWLVCAVFSGQCGWHLAATPSVSLPLMFVCWPSRCETADGFLSDFFRTTLMRRIATESEECRNRC